MSTLTTSLALGFRQLLDPAVLRILAKSLGVTLVLFAVVATGGWFALDWLLAHLGWDDAMFAGAGTLREAAALLLALTGLWLAWRILAMLVIQFFADAVVQAVERRHYPELAVRARDLSPSESLRHGAAAAGRALLANLAALPLALALLFTGLGTFAVFWLVNAVLLGRELQDMVWLRHRPHKASPSPIGRGERLLLGGAVSAMLLVPGVNLLAPVLGAAAATHLVHRKMLQGKAF